MYEVNSSQPEEEATRLAEPGVPKVEPQSQPPTPPDATRAQEQERRRRAEVFSGLRPVWELVSSGEFDDEKLMEYIAPWAEKFDCKSQDLAELLDYFELVDKLIDKEFSAKEKSEIACALAELVADGTLDAETLQSLAFRIEKGGASGTLDKVCEYSENSPGIKVYSELLERDTDGNLKNNIIHILKHEIAHGLSRYGEIGHDEETQAKIAGLIEGSEEARGRESYRSINAIDQYLAVKNREGATPEEIEEKARWLSEEILAEKTAACLQSGGEFAGFLQAIWNVMPSENHRRLNGSQELKNAWQEENRFFFEKIQSQMADKAAVKEKIMTTSAADRARLAEHQSDGDFDYSEFFGGGISEPAVPDNSKSENSNGKEGFFQMMLEGAKGVAEGSREVAEIVPGTSTRG